MGFTNAVQFAKIAKQIRIKSSKFVKIEDWRREKPELKISWLLIIHTTHILLSDENDFADSLLL